MHPPHKPPRVNHPKVVGIMGGILALLLILSFTLCYSSVFGEPDWENMTDKEMFFNIMPIVLVTNLYFFYIAGVIAAFAMRKMKLPVMIALLLLAVAVDAKITIAALGAINELESRQME